MEAPTLSDGLPLSQVDLNTPAPSKKQHSRTYSATPARLSSVTKPRSSDEEAVLLRTVSDVLRESLMALQSGQEGANAVAVAELEALSALTQEADDEETVRVPQTELEPLLSSLARLLRPPAGSPRRLRRTTRCAATSPAGSSASRQPSRSSRTLRTSPPPSPPGPPPRPRAPPPPPQTYRKRWRTRRPP